MNYNTKSKKSGFTIIEVVLVLAIAGLIFLIVFLAVPALQRSQRDQARKSDVGRIIAAVQDWKSNHRGQLPTATDLAGPGAPVGTFYSGMTKGSSLEDPSGGAYEFTLSTAVLTNTTDGKLAYSPGQVCTTSGNAMTGGGATNFAVLMKLESGDAYCQSN